jgi:hypothetical protein
MIGLAEVGFTAAQGIWIQKPLPLKELLEWDGKWARGCVLMDAPQAVEVDRAQAPAPLYPAPQAEPTVVHTTVETCVAPEPTKSELTKEEMQRAIEAVRAKRAGGTPTLQQKPTHKIEPTMPVLEVDDLEDVVEDEEVVAAPTGVKHQGFGLPGDSCPPMKSLVERRST